MLVFFSLLGIQLLWGALYMHDKDCILFSNLYCVIFFLNFILQVGLPLFKNCNI